MLNKLKMLKKQGDEGKNTFLYQSKHTVVIYMYTFDYRMIITFLLFRLQRYVKLKQ